MSTQRLVAPDGMLAAPPLGWDLRITLRMYRIMERRCGVFALASRLGDGVAWYALMALWPLVDGWRGACLSLAMLVMGLTGTLLYWALKHLIRRPRPCAVHPDLTGPVLPLDRWSFPSGHTLHAVAFSALVTTAYPWLAVLLWPFAALVAASRMVLGLHYPSDVLAGAILGTGTATLAVTVLSACGLSIHGGSW
jgi:undecaprenyl-diphosphatase